MARRFNKRATQLHDVKYPGFPTRTLHIIIDNYQQACAGDEGMQAFFIRQYRSQADVPAGQYLEWNKLSFKAVGIVVPPTPDTKKPSAHKRGGAPVPQPEKHGCTCEAPSCGACDQGWHHSCRYGCKHGQVIHTR